MEQIALHLHVFVLLPMLICGQLFDDMIFEDGDFFIGMAGFAPGNTETPSLTATPSTVTVTPSTTTDTVSPTASSIVTMSSTTTPPIGQCPTLSAPANGTVTVTCDSTNTVCTATFTCDEGYRLSGGSQIQCRTQQGTWNGNTPRCARKSCGLPAISHGQYSGDYLYGDTGTVTCDTGYALVLNNSGSIRCLESGWINLPECVFDDCGALSNPSNGVVSYDCSKVGCTANYTCNTGYQPFGNSSFTCIKDFGWEITPVCVEQATQKTVTGSGSFGSYTGAYDQNYKKEVETQLLTFLRNEVGDEIRSIVVTGLDETTGEFNFTIVADDGADVDNDLSVAMSAFVQGASIPLYGQNFAMDKVSVEGIPVNLNSTDDAEACKVFAYLSKTSCTTDTQCEIKDKKVVCTPIEKTQKDTDDGKLGIILGLALGLPLVALAFIGIVVCCRLCLVPKKRRRRNSDTDSDFSGPYISPFAIPRPAVMFPSKGPNMPRSFYTNSASSKSSDASSESDDRSSTNFSGHHLFHPYWKW